MGAALEALRAATHGDAYEAFPYACRAIPSTHVDHLALLGVAQGLDVAHPARARVLEIGSGTAANLAPIAFRLPEAQLVGVERASSHHAVALELRDRLGLDNLELVHADVRELVERPLGTFDYVIVHGVLSWVPEDVRRAIFRVLASHLAPQGVAYVSYNALPGWALRGQLRALLLDAVIGVSEPRARIALARERLELLRNALSEPSSPLDALLAREIDLARAQTDSMILHDYLADHNHAFSIDEFLGVAAQHGLAYVGELAGAVTGATVSEALQRDFGEHEVARRERVADFVGYRMFRATLLGHAAALDGPRAVPAVADWLVARSPLRPADDALELGVEGPMRFVDAETGAEAIVRDPVAKAALVELARAERPVLVRELVTRAVASLVLARERAVDSEASSGDRALVVRLLLSLRSRGLAALSFTLPIVPPPPPAPRPAALPLTRVEAALGEWATSMHHEPVHLDRVSRVLIAALDGRRDVDALVEHLLGAIARGELSVQTEGDAVADPATLRSHLPPIVAERLASLAKHGLLRPSDPLVARSSR